VPSKDGVKISSGPAASGAYGNHRLSCEMAGLTSDAGPLTIICGVRPSDVETLNVAE
jgi:hypothetical protein